MSTLLRLTAANIKSLVRDRAALFWTIFFPIMFVFLFGWIFGGGGNSKIAVGFVDQDGSPASAGLRAAFAGVPLLTLHDGSLDAEKAAMQHGDNPQGLLIGRVCNYVIAHGLKPQRLRGEVGTAVPDIRKRNKRLDRLVDFFTDTICRVQAIGSDVFPDFVCLRMPADGEQIRS